MELSGSVAPLGSPPASELSEGTSDATSMASSAAPAAEAQAAESGSSVSSAPESEKEGKKSKQHLYCPTCKVTVNSLSQLEAHNTGKGIACAGGRGGRTPHSPVLGSVQSPGMPHHQTAFAGKQRALMNVALIKKGSFRWLAKISGGVLPVLLLMEWISARSEAALLFMSLN